MKKILSTILSMLLFISILPFNSFAAGNATISVVSRTGNRGDTIKVAVNITSNSNMQACGLDLLYDKNVLEVTTYEKGTIIPSGSNLAINTGTLGKIVFSYANTTTPLTTGGTLFTVDFKIKQDSPYGVSDLKINMKEMSDGNFDKITTSVNSGIVTVIAPQLEPPSNISAISITSNSVDLLWNAVENATGYNVYVNGVKKNEVPLTENIFTVDGLNSDTNYNIEVTSLNFTTESIKSDNFVVKTEKSKHVVVFVDWQYEGYIGEGGGDFIINYSEVEHGGSAIAPEPPVREGYTFTGWDKPLTNITDFTIIQALYKPNSYNVVFEDYDGTMLKAENIDYGGNATPPTNPTRTGYTFTSWSGSYTNITSAVRLTAQYTTNTYNIEYNSNGGTGTMVNSSHAYSEEKELTTNTFTRTGYTFKGWNTMADGTGTSYSDNQSVLNLSSTQGETVTLYACWQSNTYNIAVPTNIKSSNITENTVNLSWDSVVGAISYNIYNGTTKINFEPITQTTYTVTGLTVNSTNHFTVTAVNTNGESNKSDSILVFTGNLVLGDVNNDKVVNVNDVLMILQHVTSKRVLTGNEFIAGDVTKDGKIDVNDSMKILQVITGKALGF